MESENQQDFKLMKLKGIWIVIAGITILLGPFLSYMIIGFIPFISEILSESTMLAWSYYTSFGIVVYGPIGFIVLIIGIVRIVVSNENL